MHRDWTDAEMSGRVDDVLALCSDDIEFRPPIGNPISGKAAARKFLAGGDTRIDGIEISELTIEITAELAIKKARFATQMAGRVRPLTGHHIWLLRPRWQVVLVAWSFDRPPDEA